MRKKSSNWAVLKAVQTFFVKHEWTDLDLANLPFFDPDNQFSEETPEVVMTARNLASQSDLIFISTPEYAHGVPGILKNGLEWLFHEGTQKKRAALIVGAAQGEFAQAQLIEILKTMDFEISLENSLVIKGARSKINEQGMFLDKPTEIAFQKFCEQFL